ncbi:MAG: 3-hydroxyacyl-ACP dehydratase FabZ [Brachymonas sp.]|nr:3-hydroxyacyl-ACP dehydratase FabZ [Brachymonas sp.]
MTHTLDIYKVMQLLPHRYPFLLIDRVLEAELPNKRMKAIKNVTINESFFNGHFPGRPVMPGVLMLEAAGQAATLLYLYTHYADTPPPPDTLYYLAGIDNARFKRPVIAGDQLVIEVVAERARGGIYKYHVTLHVEDELACEVDLMCAVRKIQD